MSSKNFMLSPAATDLGLGDALQQQVSDDVDERKKQLSALAAKAGVSQQMPNQLSPAGMALGLGMMNG